MRRNAKIAPRMAAQIRTALKLLNAEIRGDLDEIGKQVGSDSLPLEKQIRTDWSTYPDLVRAASVSHLTLAAWERNDESAECRAIRAGNGDDTWPDIARRQCHAIQEWFLDDHTESGYAVRAPHPEPPRFYERLVDLLKSPSLDQWKLDRPIRVRDRADGHLRVVWVWSEPPCGIENISFVTEHLDELRKAGRLPAHCDLLAGLAHRGSLKNEAELKNKREAEREEKKKQDARREELAMAEAYVAQLRAQKQKREESRAEAIRLARVFRQPTQEKTA